MGYVRAGEEKRNWFRSNRIFSTQGSWYFSTREGITIGPYLTRSEVNYGLALFVEYISHPQARFEFAERIATQGLWAVSVKSS